MLRVFYFFLISVWVVFSLPIFLYRRFILKKKTPIWRKFICPLLDQSLNADVVWLHAVSLGEMKVAVPIINKLKNDFRFDLIVTTQTETGYEHAKKMFHSNIYYMPIDFFWLQRAFIRKIRCKIFLLIESDFWLENLYQLRKDSAEIILLNGKMSNTSYARWKKFPNLARYLFGKFDLCFVQNDDYLKKYSEFLDISKIEICGNLKIAKEPQFNDSDLSRLDASKIVCIACTHEGEELELFEAIKGLINENWVIFIAPRHPERFNSVFFQLQKIHPDISRFSEKKSTSLVIVDQMGILNSIYKRSQIVVMAGSYCSKKGGHDIFEPILCGAFTYFGPYMHAQKELKKLALEHELGKEVNTHELYSEIVMRDSKMLNREEFETKVLNFRRNSSDGFNKVYSHLAEIFAKKNIKKITQ